MQTLGQKTSNRKIRYSLLHCVSYKVYFLNNIHYIQKSWAKTKVNQCKQRRTRPLKHRKISKKSAKRTTGLFRGVRSVPGALKAEVTPVVKVDRRIRWHYTPTILRLRIGARLTRYRNCKFHNFARTISRHADGISRYTVPPSAGQLLPLSYTKAIKIFWFGYTYWKQVLTSYFVSTLKYVWIILLKWLFSISQGKVATSEGEVDNL